MTQQEWRSIETGRVEVNETNLRIEAEPTAGRTRATNRFHPPSILNLTTVRLRRKRLANRAVPWTGCKEGK